jgi:hypothetical protein
MMKDAVHFLLRKVMQIILNTVLLMSSGITFLLPGKQIQRDFAHTYSADVVQQLLAGILVDCHHCSNSPGTQRERQN